MAADATSGGDGGGTGGGVLHQQQQQQQQQQQSGPVMAIIDQVIRRHRRRYQHRQQHQQHHLRRGDCRDTSSASSSLGDSHALLADSDGDGLFWRQVSGSADPLSALMCAHRLPGYTRDSHAHSNQTRANGALQHHLHPVVRVLVRVVNRWVELLNHHTPY